MLLVSFTLQMFTVTKDWGWVIHYHHGQLKYRLGPVPFVFCILCVCVFFVPLLHYSFLFCSIFHIIFFHVPTHFITLSVYSPTPPLSLITSEVFIEVIILVFCQSVSIFLSIPAVIICSVFPSLILPAWTPSWNLQFNSGATCGQFFVHVIEAAETGCRIWAVMSNVTTSDTWSCEFLHPRCQTHISGETRETFLQRTLCECDMAGKHRCEGENVWRLYSI